MGGFAASVVLSLAKCRGFTIDRANSICQVDYLADIFPATISLVFRVFVLAVDVCFAVGRVAASFMLPLLNQTNPRLVGFQVLLQAVHVILARALQFLSHSAEFVLAAF